MAGFLSAADDAPCPGDRWCAESAAARHPVNGLESEAEVVLDVMHGAPSSLFDQTDGGHTTCSG